MDSVAASGSQMLGGAWLVLWTLAQIVAVLVPVLLCVAYLTYWERKMIGWMHVRVGPNRVGPYGLLQPIADAVKLIFKEVITPSQADRPLFYLAPILVLMPALAAWSVIPFGPGVVLADVNAGLLFLMAVTSVGIYGVIIAGWASNSKYAFLGSMRAAAQMVSYELAMGFVLVAVLLVSGTMNLTGIVEGQNQGWFAERGLTGAPRSIEQMAEFARRATDPGKPRSPLARCDRNGRDRSVDRQRASGQAATKKNWVRW